MEIRRAASADIAAMWELRTRAVRSSCASHYAADVIAAWAATPVPDSYEAQVAAGGALLAEQAGKLLGYSILILESGEVDAVFVDPLSAGRGVGRALLRGLEQMAAARWAPPLHLYASLNAVEFYQAAGYVAVRGHRYAHPSGLLLDCVYMERRVALPVTA